jgi:hypothetical protein
MALQRFAELANGAAFIEKDKFWNLLLGLGLFQGLTVEQAVQKVNEQFPLADVDGRFLCRSPLRLRPLSALKLRLRPPFLATAVVWTAPSSVATTPSWRTCRSSARRAAAAPPAPSARRAARRGRFWRRTARRRSAAGARRWGRCRSEAAAEGYEGVRGDTQGRLVIHTRHACAPAECAPPTRRWLRCARQSRRTDTLRWMQPAGMMPHRACGACACSASRCRSSASRTPPAYRCAKRIVTCRHACGHALAPSRCQTRSPLVSDEAQRRWSSSAHACSREETPAASFTRVQQR